MNVRKQEKNIYQVKAVSRALAILFSFQADEVEKTFGDLQRSLGIGKASLLRLLRTLEHERLLERHGDAYRLGSRVLELASCYLEALSLPDVVRPYFKHIADEFGLTVSLGVLEGMNVVYLVVENAKQEIGVQGIVGARHPANTTALGKVLLSALSGAERERAVRTGPLVRLTPNSICEPESLLRVLEKVRSQGYATDNEERGLGIRCLAVPIRDQSGAVCAAMSIAGPSFKMTDALLDRCLQTLQETAREISTRLGYRATA